MTDTSPIKIINKDNMDNVNKIYKLYNHLSYFDVYGDSIILFIIITLFVLFVHLYCMVMKNSEEIKDDWLNQRCNPKVIPFAGFINKPDGKTIAEFTGENFNSCIQNVLVNITGYSVQPFNYLALALSSVFGTIMKSVEIIRTFLANLRNNFSKIAKDILDKFLNLIVPLQQIFIAFNDTINKTIGIMTAGLYTTLGIYYALKSFLGAIVQLIIQILIALAIVIVGLWILPFTWPVALTMSSVFLAISIPLTIMVVFMTEVMHIQSDGIPRLSSCFDKNTMIKMNNGDTKSILNIEVGDVLDKNNVVTATMKLNAKGIEMYNVNGVIVSGSHILLYKDKWIPVYLHPEKILLKQYNEPYIYCLNTSSKEIIINNIIFTDWDELYNDALTKILNTKIKIKGHSEKIKRKENIHLLLDKGFEKGSTVLKDGKSIPIESIQIGDKLGNDIVYGIVHIKDNKNYLGTVIKEKDKYLENNKTNESISKSNILFHLLTISKKFTVNGEVFGDYNSLIDLHFLNI